MVFVELGLRELLYRAAQFIETTGYGSQRHGCGLGISSGVARGHTGGSPRRARGQPEINSGIASTIGPWSMCEMIRMSRTIELTLTGRLMDVTNVIGSDLCTSSAQKSWFCQRR